MLQLRLEHAASICIFAPIKRYLRLLRIISMPDCPNSHRAARPSHLYLVSKQEPECLQRSGPTPEDQAIGGSARKACKNSRGLRSVDGSHALVNQTASKKDNGRQVRDRVSDVDEIWVSGVLPITLLIAIGIIHFTIFSVLWQSVPTYVVWHP